MSTKIPELDRALGGGVVSGQVILLAGEPGIGKSTLLMQLSQKLGKVIYISGEESAHQIALRAKRLGVTNKSLEILEETNIDNILESPGSPNAIVVDSIQTMYTPDLRGVAGSVGQVRECAARLVRLAKSTGTIIFIVGHVTKIGTVAGPSALMHIVDTVLWFEGEQDLSLRLIRATKNRFGAVDEVGIFTMTDKGLEGVTNTQKLFLSGTKTAGSCVTVILEGTRPILVEIEALVVPTRLAFAKRVAQGIDVKRLELVLAILDRRASIPVSNFDVYVNVTGGIHLKEPAADLAIALAVASAHADIALPTNTLALGELSLSGEIKAAQGSERRLKEAKRLGYKSLIDSSHSKYLSQVIHKFFKQQNKPKK